jgi:hypothetical protein
LTFYLTAYGSPAKRGISHLDSINSFSNRQNNLADVFAALHQFVRFGGIFQGETSSDEGFNLSAFDQRPDFGA